MKKIISFLSLIIFLFCLSGCNGAKTGVSPITKGITFKAELTYYNECFAGDVTVNKKGEMTVQITSPESLKDLKLVFKDSGVTAEYLGLRYENGLPTGEQIFGRLYEILKATLSKDTEVLKEKDNYIIRGSAEGGKFIMYLGATGLPISAEDTQNGFTVNFKNISIID